ncbi:FluG domain-containing protein [Coniochaeta sp. 2T2.1]|nr:FluG domain-containing protein [Coniochaeta sp. 2T2.1]
MMRHDPKWATFNSAYINAKVKFHLQNAVIHEAHEDALIEMLTHISVTRDPRAGRDIVPDEVWQDMPPDPEIVELEQRREKLKGGQYRIRGRDNEQEIRNLTKEIRSKTAQRVKDIMKENRADYFYNRPTWDIERQARGEDGEEEEYAERTIELQIPERAQLAQIFCNQPEDLSHEDLSSLRIPAAELWAALCHKRETVKRDRRRLPATVMAKEEPPRPDAFPLLMDGKQCPRCIGDERLSFAERTFKYCQPAVMYDHFDREHLGEMKENEKHNLIFCDHPKCKEEGVKLKHLEGPRNELSRRLTSSE